MNNGLKNFHSINLAMYSGVGREWSSFLEAKSQYEFMIICGEQMADAMFTQLLFVAAATLKVSAFLTKLSSATF